MLNCFKLTENNYLIKLFIIVIISSFIFSCSCSSCKNKQNKLEQESKLKKAEKLPKKFIDALNLINDARKAAEGFPIWGEEDEKNYDYIRGRIYLKIEESIKESEEFYNKIMQRLKGFK